MDVTVDNFKQVLDEFDKVIDEATFFSIDSEFTGLYSERTPPFMTPNEFYKKLHAGTDEYIIVQLGITAFRVDPDDSNKITYKSYNFYVYPQGKDQNMRCSGSCLTFLAEQKFDFNRLFRKGVSCCTQDVSQKLRTMYDERKRNREDALEVSDERASNYDEVSVPLEELDRVNESRARIEAFVNAADPEKEKNIIFGGCNAFQRKLIYQIVEKQFHDKVTATSQVKNNQKVLVIERKWSAERQLADVEKRNEDDENEYRRLVGLSAILFKISQSKKLIVGHNMFMDLFYLVRQFFEPLADKLKLFKKQAHRVFPNIIDTKHICNSKFRNEIPSSVLAHLFEAVSQTPFNLPTIEPATPEYGYTDSKEHEAGYDSYMTGVGFLGLAQKLKVTSADLAKRSGPLRQLLNKIFVMRLSDIYYIDLMGNEPTPNREHVFHARFPDTWTQGDLNNHFNKFGPVQTRWIDSCSAFVLLSHRENAPAVLATIDKRKNVEVSTFATYASRAGLDDDNSNDDDATNSSAAAAAKRSCPEISSNPRPHKQAKVTNAKQGPSAPPKVTEFATPVAWPEDE